MVKKLINKITIICITFAVMLAPIISTIGIKSKSKVYATSHSTMAGITPIMLNDGSDASINSAGASALATALGSYNTLLSTVDEDGTSVANQEIYVEFGGLTWLVTYLSKSSAGTNNNDIIATLWVADTIDLNDDGVYDASDTVGWNSGWYRMNIPTGLVYPINMYENSYIRSVLNGTQYLQAYTDSVGGTPATGEYNGNKYGMTGGTSTQNNLFKKFNGNDTIDLTQYIVQPKYVSWQATGQSYTVLNNDSITKDLPNCNYSNELTTLNGGDFNDYMDYTGLVYGGVGLYDLQNGNPYGQPYLGNSYGAWSEDYLWLPSFVEVGSNNANSIWSLTSAQRAFGTANNSPLLSQDVSWMRSGRWDYYMCAVIVSPAGGSGYNSVGSSYAVRPALHLNLKEVLPASQPVEPSTGVVTDILIPVVAVGTMAVVVAFVIVDSKRKYSL